MSELPDDDRCEMILLSSTYRGFFSRGDRNKVDGVIGQNSDPDTGIAKTSADLIPERLARRGFDLESIAPIMPDDLAMAVLRRNEVDAAGRLTDSRPAFKFVRSIQLVAERPDLKNPGRTREDEIGFYSRFERARAEEEALHLERNEPGTKAIIREVHGRDALTAEEKEYVAVLTRRFEAALHRFAERGWVALEAPVEFTPVGPENLPANNNYGRKGVSDTGSIFQARWLPLGIEEAIRRCSDHPIYGQLGKFSSLSSFDEEIQSRAAVSTPHAYSAWKAEEQAQT